MLPEPWTSFQASALLTLHGLILISVRFQVLLEISSVRGSLRHVDAAQFFSTSKLAPERSAGAVSHGRCIQSDTRSLKATALFFGDYYLNLWHKPNIDKVQSCKTAHCTLSSAGHFCMSKHTRLESENPTLATVTLDVSIIVSNNPCMILWAVAMVLMLKTRSGPCEGSQYNALANHFRIISLIIKEFHII